VAEVLDPANASGSMQDTPLVPTDLDDYWRSREHKVYLREVRALVGAVGKDAKSILDVGSNGCRYLDWFDWIPRRVSLDLSNPYRSETVASIRADFLTHSFEERFDVCLCLQVLEHVQDATAFARKLLTIASHVIVSVPYRWSIEKCAEHVHDPVDETKVTAWFGREPSRWLLTEERKGKGRRLICYFSACRQCQSTAS
jgi:hypothetical protein